MKFSKKLNEFINPKYRKYYIAYKDLKKAIKLITGTDTSTYTIRDVTSNFGHIRALSGSIYRPAESRFQDLLNHELDKINTFTNITVNSVYAALRSALKKLYEDELSEKEVLEIESHIDEQANEIVFLDSYQRLNFTGFRKITKKYDKNNRSASSSWYMTRLIKEYFMNVDFDHLLVLLSVCYNQLRNVKINKKLIHNISYNSEDENSQARDRSTKYLVQPNDIMRVKVLILKYVSLNVISGNKTDEEENIKMFLSPINKFYSSSSSSSAPSGTQNISFSPPSSSSSSQNAFSHTPSAIASHGHHPGVQKAKLSTSCVYFDNQNFDEYNSLISKRKCLDKNYFRFRWLGENPLIISSSSFQDKNIFVERISPYEAANDVLEYNTRDNGEENWTDSVCVKQRYILPLIKNNLEIKTYVEKHISEEGWDEAKQLLIFVTDRITSKELKPRVRASYNRTSFRNKEGNVFINLDENVRYLSEWGNANPECWIRQTTEALVSEDVQAFPWGILDISLDNMHNTNFLKEITGLASVTEVWGFSTFVHGVAFLHRNKLNVLPHWFQYTSDHAYNENEPEHKTDEGENAEEAERNGKNNLTAGGGGTGGGGRGRTGSSSGKEKEKIEEGDDEKQVSKDIKVDVVYQGASSRLVHEQEASMQEYASADYDVMGGAMHPSKSCQLPHQSPRPSLPLPPPSYTSSFPHRVIPQAPLPPPPSMPDGNIKGGGYRTDALNDLSVPLLTEGGGGGRGGGGARVLSRSNNNNNNKQNDNQEEGGSSNEDDNTCFLITKRKCKNCLSKCVPWRRGNTSARTNRINPSNNNNNNNKERQMMQASVRVEPKTFFANERTLLQWMNTAVLLSTISITLLNFGTNTSRVAGLVISPVAIFFIVYSFSVYIKRSYSLERKEPINYNDRLGPTVLVVCLVVALTTVIGLNVMYGEDLQLRPASPGKFHMPQNAHRVDLNGNDFTYNYPYTNYVDSSEYSNNYNNVKGGYNGEYYSKNTNKKKRKHNMQNTHHNGKEYSNDYDDGDGHSNRSHGKQEKTHTYTQNATNNKNSKNSDNDEGAYYVKNEGDGGMYTNDKNVNDIVEEQRSEEKQEEKNGGRNHIVTGGGIGGKHKGAKIDNNNKNSNNDNKNSTYSSINNSNDDGKNSSNTNNKNNNNNNNNSSVAAMLLHNNKPHMNNNMKHNLHKTNNQNAQTDDRQNIQNTTEEKNNNSQTDIYS